MNAAQQQTVEKIIEILKKASNFCGEQGGDICESIDEDISKAIELLEAKNEARDSHKITIDREFWKIEIEDKDRKNSVRWNNLLYDFYNALKGMGYGFDEETQEKFEDLIGDGDEF